MIVPLNRATDIRQVGGKAAALGRMLRAGLPVPAGFVIPVTAFEQHVGRALATLAPDASLSDRVRAIKRTPISRELIRDIQNGFETYIRSQAVVRSKIRLGLRSPANSILS